MDYLHRLRPKSEVDLDTSAFSQDGLVIYERFGADAYAWSLEVADRLNATIFEAVPELASETAVPRVFMRGVRSSVLRGMRMVAGDELDPITDEGADVARDFARRGLDVGILMHTHRIGVPVMADAHIEAARELLPPDEAASEAQRLSRLFFDWLERFSVQMAEAFEVERELWEASRDAERLMIANSLLSSREVDARVVKRVLDYELDADHVAVVAWADNLNWDEPGALAWAAHDELVALGATSTVVIPVGGSTAWGWGTVPPGAQTKSYEPPPGIFVGSSQVHSDAEGFRVAHREAKEVEALLRMSARTLPRAVRHTDVELATLLASDLDRAKRFVRRQLGRLALNDDRTDAIRETLWLYLQSERSIAAVAELQFIARNTVTYRVKQAEQLAGRRVSDDRLNLQAALLLSRLFGDRVLLRP